MSSFMDYLLTTSWEHIIRDFTCPILIGREQQEGVTGATPLYIIRPSLTDASIVGNNRREDNDENHANNNAANDTCKYAITDAASTLWLLCIQ